MADDGYSGAVEAELGVGVKLFVIVSSFRERRTVYDERINLDIIGIFVFIYRTICKGMYEYCVKSSNSISNS